MGSATNSWRSVVDRKALEARTKAFAVRVIRFVTSLPRNGRPVSVFL